MKDTKDMRTTISYKVNEEWIYKEVESHSGKGNWVKDILSAYIKGDLVYKNGLNNNSNNYVNNQENQLNNKQNDIDFEELGCILDEK